MLQREISRNLCTWAMAGVAIQGPQITNRQLTPASQNSTPSIRTPLSDKSHSLQIWHESLFIEGVAISSKQREFVYE